MNREDFVDTWVQKLSSSPYNLPHDTMVRLFKEISTIYIISEEAHAAWQDFDLTAHPNFDMLKYPEDAPTSAYINGMKLRTFPMTYDDWVNAFMDAFEKPTSCDRTQMHEDFLDLWYTNDCSGTAETDCGHWYTEEQTSPDSDKFWGSCEEHDEWVTEEEQRLADAAQAEIDRLQKIEDDKKKAEEKRLADEADKKRREEEAKNAAPFRIQQCLDVATP